MSDTGNGPSAISYTRKRTTTKTRNAASSARRRKNIPLCHASGGGGDGGDQADGKDQHSWFARKSVGWTDEEIKSHLVSGGTSKGGASFSMVGDVILGDGPKKEKKRKAKRRGGPMFAWEEEEGEGDDQDENMYNKTERVMAAAPTLLDIMDEKDKIDFMSPLKVGEQYQMKESMDGDVKGGSNKSKTKSKLRSQNAALAELAQVSGVDHGGRQPTSANSVTIGLRLLRVLGYRSRLGLAFVPLSGHVGGKDSIDNEVKEMEREGKPAHEAKWLASKRLRAIYLPSIQSIDPNEINDKHTPKSKVLTIPPPKMDRHGISYDPFKNAPEFRAFHEQRRALAQKRGRGIELPSEAEGDRKGDRYFTDSLRKDNRQGLWDKNHDDGKESDDMSDPGNQNSKGRAEHSHYAADRDYSDFIGTKASSGFALQDEDDANVYQDDGGHAFPSRGVDRGGDGTSQYTMEVQSPVASDEDDDAFGDGLFGKSTTSATIGSRRKAAEKRLNESEDKGEIADAWGAWGMGEGSENATGVTTKTTTMDGKPPLPGFKLSQSVLFNSDNPQTKPDTPRRWRGPTVPPGYVLKRHVFQIKDEHAANASGKDSMDSGLGLDLHNRQNQRPSRSFAPKVLPKLDDGQKQPTSQQMLAKDGTELKFHAVRESMKSRFVSSAGTTNAQEIAPAADGDSNSHNMDKEEWVQVTVTPWIPTRLLCKRWGVPVPSTAGMSAAGAVGSAGRLQNKEEEYFRQTVYEPAQRQKDEDTPKGSNGKKGGVSTSISTYHRTNAGIMLDTAIGEGDTDPPPTRPSVEVFQSIFDAESDMDISSSEDDELQRDDQDKGASYTNPVHTTTQPKNTDEQDVDAAKDNSKTAPMKDIISGATTKLSPPGKMDKASDGDDPSTAGGVSSSSQKSKQKHKRHRHHHRSRDVSNNFDEDEKKRSKAKHRQRHRRRRHSDSDFDEESRGHASDDSRRKKSKKHKHRSRSRHKKTKHRT
ncbi:hypothetical protein ACHAXR_005381 [Thalassiosira sp. AJA248-18]